MALEDYNIQHAPLQLPFRTGRGLPARAPCATLRAEVVLRSRFPVEGSIVFRALAAPFPRLPGYGSRATAPALVLVAFLFPAQLINPLVSEALLPPGAKPGGGSAAMADSAQNGPMQGGAGGGAVVSGWLAGLPEEAHVLA